MTLYSESVLIQEASKQKGIGYIKTWGLTLFSFQHQSAIKTL